MRLLTLDQSITRTGWVFWEVPSPEHRMLCGSFSCKEPADDADKCELFAVEVRKLRTRFRPDFISWEQASRKISGFRKNSDFIDEQMAAMGRPRFTVNAKVLMLPEIQGIIRGIAISYMIPHESVPFGTWRAGIFGGGQGNLDRDSAKRKAVEICKLLNVKVANHDEAEAACIAMWTARASQKFKMATWRHEVEQAAATA